ncbi:helix-turn-helix transcriptional regulator, partial [Oscillatoriales cyanobacterium LEGE 11467]
FHASYEVNGTWRHQHYTHGDIVIFPANEPFPTTQIDRDVELIELFLEPAMLSQTVGESVAESIELVPQPKLRDPLIQQMGLALKAELEAGGSDSRLYASSMAAALSVHLLRRYSSSPTETKDYVGGLPKYKLKQAISYIHDRLDRSFTLNELAAAVQMSPHYFATLFKQSTGRTPLQYATHCRIEKAKQLLRQGEYPIVEIALQVGFTNQSHFTRVFRKYTQTTPKVYRDTR